MIAEVGLFALILALLFSAALIVVPIAGICFNRPHWQAAAPIYALWLAGFVGLSYLCLTVCFLCNDFTVRYVLANSSVSLPIFYKLCAVWGGHEGSMLLWVVILNIWTVSVAFFSRGLDDGFRVRVLVVLGALSMGFILFLLTTSNPFLRQFEQLHSQGRDLNPLLQDPGFLFHPPMLYMGYVGFSVAFAFAIAALWMGEVKSAWAKWARPWTMAAWCCLTAGITLGSWWAYRELGWGGWWFWDPVENASFMPWLVGTALLHSLMVSEVRQQFVAWTLLLAITAFSLSLVGTFLVRSGILTSVHAFAVDPQRGLYILFFLLFVIGGSLLLFACRAQTLRRQLPPNIVSRDSALLLNNVFLVVTMVTVLLGTIYPLLIDGLGLGKLSVGAPYFNTVFVPLMVPLFILMGLGIHARWQRDQLKRLVHVLRLPFLISTVVPISIVIFFAKNANLSVLLGLVLGFWVILSTVQMVWSRLKQRLPVRQAFLGMMLAHIGVGVTILGIAISCGYGMQDDVRMSQGTHIQFAGFDLNFVQEKSMMGANYRGSRVEMLISTKHRQVRIYPEKRIYTIGNMPMTEAAIDVTPFRDVYIALGAPLDDTTWSVRVYYKPFVRWIWMGGFLMVCGGLLALTDRRYYGKRLETIQ
jgi:cytochrome c-type biogenesis protein CcmF